MFALFSVFDFVSPDRLVFGQPWMDWFIQVGISWQAIRRHIK